MESPHPDAADTPADVENAGCINRHTGHVQRHQGLQTGYNNAKC